MPEAVSKTQPTKRRRKTFTGCWTCRSRRVKCDEQRPHCKRCQVGGFDCQGYGVRLTWVSQPAGKGSSSRHALPIPEENIAAGERQKENGPTLGVSNDCREKQKPLTTTFRADAQDIGEGLPPQDEDPKGLDVELGSDSAAFSDEIVSFDGLSPIPLLFASSTDSTWSPEGLVLDPWLVAEGDALNTFNTSTSTNLTIAQQSDSSDSQPPTSDTIAARYPYSSHSHRSTNDLWMLPNLAPGSPTAHIDSITGPAIQRGLINHWVTQLCDKLIPFRSSVNPFLTVASPMALEGSRLARDPTKSTSSVALFHAVCAASATHQANLRGDRPGGNALALRHTRLSLEHLIRNMKSPDAGERMASLGAFCLVLLTHFISGTPGVWRELVKMARNLLETVSKEMWTQSTSTSLTYQCYAFCFALLQSQYFSSRERPKPLKLDLAGLDLCRSQAIPSRSLELISSFNAKMLQGSVLSDEELDDLEMEFALSTPPPSPDVDINKQDSAAMHHHHSSLFYYASLLYFKCNSGRRGPENEVQDLVGKCLDHIEHLDTMPMGGGPRSWVYATMAFEAGTPALRDRVRARFVHHQQSLGFATFDTILLAAEEVWKIRDVTPAGWAPTPWPRVLSEMPQFDILLY